METAAIFALLLLWPVLPVLYEHTGEPSGDLPRASVTVGAAGPGIAPDSQGKVDADVGGEEGWHDLCAVLLFKHWTEAYGIEEGAKRKLRSSQGQTPQEHRTAEAGANDLKAARELPHFPDVTEISHATQQKCADLLNTAPPPASAPSPSVLTPPLRGAPPAKHLQQCARVTALRGQWEERGPKGEPPSWAAYEGQTHGTPTAHPPTAVHHRSPTTRRGSAVSTAGAPSSVDGGVEACDCTERVQSESQSQGPCPSWVEGSDADNLPGTRRAQAGIWLHQFPPDSVCSTPGHAPGSPEPGQIQGSSEVGPPVAGPEAAPCADSGPSAIAIGTRGPGPGTVTETRAEAWPETGPQAGPPGEGQLGGREEAVCTAGRPEASGTGGGSGEGVPGAKFLLVDWDSCEYHGMGAQLHFMTHMLGLAMTYGRILVPFPGTYCRANHEGCAMAASGAAAAMAASSGGSPRGVDSTGTLPGGGHSSLTCYFRNFVSEACERRAVGLYEADPSSHVLVGRAPEELWSRGDPGSVLILGKREKYSMLIRALRGDSAVVRASLLLAGKSNAAAREEAVPAVWGTPWSDTDSLAALGEPLEERAGERGVEEAREGEGIVAGTDGRLGPEGGSGSDGGKGSGERAASPKGRDMGGLEHQRWRLKLLWWRAQGVRFLLRAPSAYLCHLLNLGRHQAYGMQVARDTVAGLLKARNTVAGSTGVGNIVARSTVAGDPGQWNPRPYLPRPMVRVHVRGSDLRVEAQVFPFWAYMAEADRVRERLFQRLKLGAPLAPLAGNLGEGGGVASEAHGVPAAASWHTSGLWLSSEEQTVFEEARAVLGHTEGSQDRGGVLAEQEGLHTRNRYEHGYLWRLYTLEMEQKWRDEDMQDALNSTVKALRRGQWEYALRSGLRDVVEASLVNLLISVESDGFVLSLSSNFNRLANELRITGGRLRSPIALVGPSRDW